MLVSAASSPPSETELRAAVTFPVTIMFRDDASFQFNLRRDGSPSWSDLRRERNDTILSRCKQAVRRLAATLTNLIARLGDLPATLPSKQYQKENKGSGIHHATHRTPYEDPLSNSHILSCSRLVWPLPRDVLLFLVAFPH